jgi:hypothetical protein
VASLPREKDTIVGHYVGRLGPTFRDFSLLVRSLIGHSDSFNG